MTSDSAEARELGEEILTASVRDVLGRETATVRGSAHNKLKEGKLVICQLCGTADVQKT